MKAKEPVRLRKRKLKDGSTSLYLDIYSGGVRSYEYLRMYLIPERNVSDRNVNNQTMRMAEAVKARRLLDLQAGRYELTRKDRDLTVREYLEQFVENKRLSRSAGTYEVWSYYAKAVIKDFKQINAPISAVNANWITAYTKFVKSRNLSPRTESFYMQRVKMLFAQAERDGVVLLSPLKNLKLKQPPAAKRVYLTYDEVRTLFRTPCPNEIVKRAFIFGCLTGLRYSDISKLKWGDIEQYGNRSRILFRQKKTGTEEYLDLTPQALQLLGERRSEEDLVFERLPQRHDLHDSLAPWASAAHVSKPISFHTSRHTFAVLMLELGTDIYTLSRLLGHKDVSTTQIYADILDSRKRDAVMKIPRL